MTLQRQLWLLAGIRIIRMCMLTMPIIVLYWQSYGLSLVDIFILQVVFSIAVVVLEVPTGYLADTIGHKQSIVIGSIFTVLGFLAYATGAGFWGFVIAELLLAVSSGLYSGAMEALLFDSLEEAEAVPRYQKLQGQQFALGNISEAVAAIGGGLGAAWFGLAAVFHAQWLLMLTALPLALLLVTPKRTSTRTAPLPLRQVIRGTLRENSRLQWLAVYSSGLGAATLTMVWLAQPLWQTAEVPIVYFGYLWALFNLTVAIGSTIAYYLEASTSFRNLFGGLAVALIVLFISVGLLSSTWWVLLVMPGFWLLRGISRPLISDYVQREAGSSERATTLSINMLANRLVFAVCSPLVGWVGDVYSLTIACFAAAIVFGVIVVGGWCGLMVTYSKPSTSHT